MTATIETAHLRLEALADADVATLAGLWRDERVQQFLGGVLSPSDAQARASSVVRRWAVDGYGLWAVRDKATGGLIGLYGFSPFEADIEVSYKLFPLYWGRGLATEAGLASLDDGFRTLAPGRIVAITQEANRSSQRVLEKLGMRHERGLRMWDADQRLYALTRVEWLDLSREHGNDGAHSPSAGISIGRAGPTDLDTVLGILEDAARWLTSRGIDQWRPGSFDRRALADRAGRGELYLARVDGRPAGTLTLQTSDPLFWPGAPDDARYLHKLAVRRVHAGQGLGRRLLQWAEEATAAAGKRYLRLDCMAESVALRAYYEAAGFAHRGDKYGKDWSASLYEKIVGG